MKKNLLFVAVAVLLCAAAVLVLVSDVPNLFAAMAWGNDGVSTFAMVTLAGAKVRDYQMGEKEEYPVVADDIIYRGSAIGADGNGFARPLVASDIFLGFAIESVDNSGGLAGDRGVNVRKKGNIVLSVSGLGVEANDRPSVYASDDDTFTLTATGNSLIGFVSRWVSDGVGVVEFDAVVAAALSQGGGVTPLGPTTATFTAGDASGSLIALISGLQDGETITGVMPNDGRLAIAGGGTLLVVGLSASSAGSIAAVLTSSAGRTLNMAITVDAAPYSWDVSSFNPFLWYDASDLSTISATDGRLEVWANKGSAVGADATATGADRPTSGAVTSSTGLNALGFSGTNILAIVGEALTIANGPNWLVVFAKSATTGQQFVICGSTVGTRWGPLFNAGATPGRVDSVSNSASVTQSTTGQDLTGAMSFIMRAGEKMGVQGHLNGARLATTAAARVNVDLTALRIGGTALNTSSRFNGEIYEIVAGRGSLSLDAMAKLAGYGRAKWGCKTPIGILDEWAIDDPRTVRHKQNVVVWGDSLAEGQGSTDPATKSWPYLLSQSRGCRVAKKAYPGQSSVYIKSQMVADEDFPDRIQIFSGGRNDYSFAGQVEASTAEMYAWQTSGRVIIQTVLNGNLAGSQPGGAEYENIKTITDNFKATYGDEVFDIRRALVDDGAPGGFSPDPTRYPLDQWPDAYRTNPGTDPVHPNDLGYARWHTHIAADLAGRNWDYAP